MNALLLTLVLISNTYQASVSNVHDGDTFTCTVSLDFDLAIINKPVRMYGFDAWELTRTRTTVGTITEAEIEKGKLAKKALQEILSKGTVYIEPKEGGFDKYGRILGVVYVKEKTTGKMINVGDEMIRLGHQRK